MHGMPLGTAQRVRALHLEGSKPKQIAKTVEKKLSQVLAVLADTPDDLDQLSQLGPATLEQEMALEALVKERALIIQQGWSEQERLSRRVALPTEWELPWIFFR